MGKHLFVHDSKGEIILHTYTANELNSIPEGVKVLYSSEDIDMKNYDVVGIDLETKKPILEKIDNTLTESEQIQIAYAELAYKLMTKDGVL